MARIWDADPHLWRELKIEAIRRDVTVGALWNEIMRDWLERRATSQSAPSNGREAAARIA